MPDVMYASCAPRPEGPLDGRLSVRCATYRPSIEIGTGQHPHFATSTPPTWDAMATWIEPISPDYSVLTPPGDPLYPFH
jgi:hypothetical protein